MAKCKICKTNIPEGTEYCNDCLDKKDVKTNESYLDSLLNSVKNTSATAENVYIRNHTKQKQESKVDEITHKSDHLLSEVTDSELNELDNRTYFSDLEDIKDYDSYDIKDDIEDMKENDSYDINDDLENMKEIDNYDIKDDLEDNIIISDEDLFGNYFSEEEKENDFDTKESDIAKQIQDRTEDEEDILEQENITEENDYVEQDRIEEDEIQELEDKIEKNEIQEQPVRTEAFDQEIPMDLDNISLDLDFGRSNSDEKVFQQNENIDAEFLQNLPSQEEDEDYEDEEAFDPGLGDLLNSLDISGDIFDTEQSVQQADDTSETSIQEMEEDSIKTDEDDIMSMLTQFSSDDPVAADVQAISDLLNGVNIQPQQDNTIPGDVGEVFSDALKVVSSLDDLDSEEPLLQQMPEQENQDNTRKNKKAKEKKIKKKDKAEKKKSKEVKGKGLLGKLFSNVIDENEKKPNKQKKKNDEESASKATGKVKKAGKKKIGTLEGDDSLDKEAVGEDKRQNKKEKKAEKKDKKKDKKKDAIQVIEEIEEEEGRINRLGASIVFVFFGIIVLLLIIGTNILSYSLSIRHAEKYFERQKYTEAYNEVYGIDIKDEDIALYDKIMTVMFVNKQLNSYNNNYEMKKYPEALDSLLKGLSRYDKYIELATILGIRTDLDYIKDQIIDELDDVYHLSEKEARNIMKCNSQIEYSKGVYDVVSENIKY